MTRQMVGFALIALFCAGCTTKTVNVGNSAKPKYTCGKSLELGDEYRPILH